MDWLPDEEEDTTRAKMTFRAIMDEKYYDETPTLKVYAGALQTTKHISRIVKLLNEIAPIPELKHLKRVKRHEGRSYVILDRLPKVEEEAECPAKKIRLNENSYLEVLKEKGFDSEELGVVGVEVVDVPRFGPLTRMQYEKAMKYWPVNFHPEKKLETMMSERIFDEDEHKHHVECMRYVMRRCRGSKKNTALVVDFTSKQYIAVGEDRTDDHPLQHAVMVAVDAVASTHKGGAWELPFSQFTFSNEAPPRPQPARDLDPELEDIGPYLCTGYDLYVVREPCVMCAMSLVHSRIKRVFFRSRDSEKGALVSKCQIHTIRDLNHHYDVFEVVRG